VNGNWHKLSAEKLFEKYYFDSTAKFEDCMAALISKYYELMLGKNLSKGVDKQ
jgi:hypothetical protein